MGRPYSLDLRTRVVAAMAAGMSGREAAKHFSIGEATALRWIRRMRDMGSPQAKPMGGKRPFALEAHRSRIITRLAEKPDLTLLALLAELKALGATASSYVLWGIVANAGLSFKNVWPAPSASSFCDMNLASLHQRIRPVGTAPAKMEIRASRSS